MINNRIGVGEYIEILNTSAPSSTDNRLYKVGTKLYWNGTELGSSGAITSITRVISSHTTLDDTSEKLQILTSSSAYNIILSNTLSNNDFFIIQNNNTVGSSLFTVYQTYSGSNYLLDYIPIRTTCKYIFINGKWIKDIEFKSHSIISTDIDTSINIGLLNRSILSFVNNFNNYTTLIGINNSTSATNTTVTGVENNLYTSNSYAYIYGNRNTIGNSNTYVFGENNSITNGQNVVISSNLTLGSGSNVLIGGFSAGGGVQANNVLIGFTHTLAYACASCVVVGQGSNLSSSSYTSLIGTGLVSSHSYQSIAGNNTKGVRLGEQWRSPDGGVGGHGICTFYRYLNNLSGSIYVLNNVGEQFTLKNSSILNFNIKLVIYEYNLPTPVKALGGYNWRGVIGVSPTGVGSFIGTPIEESWLDVDFGDATCSISIVDSTPDYLDLIYTKNSSTKSIEIVATMEYTEMNLVSR